MKKHTFLYGLVVMALLLCIVLTASCKQEKGNPLLGTWSRTDTQGTASVTVTYEFKTDGTVIYNYIPKVDGVVVPGASETQSGTYVYTDSSLTVTISGEEPMTLSYTVGGNVLTLINGTASQQLTKQS